MEKGKEFNAKCVQELLSTLYIRFRVAKNPDMKALSVEPVNRTIKQRMCRYCTSKKTYKYTYRYFTRDEQCLQS